MQCASSILHFVPFHVAVCCSVAVHCSVLQCVALCCTVLHCASSIVRYMQVYVCEGANISAKISAKISANICM